MQDIIIGSDHRGYELKNQIKAYLTEKKFFFVDVGVQTTQTPTGQEEVPPILSVVKEVTDVVNSAKHFCGILICSNGVGMSIAANRFKGIRAALCYSVDVARNAREHNDANVLCISPLVDFETTKKIITTFLNTKLLPELRYKKRIEMFDTIC